MRLIAALLLLMAGHWATAQILPAACPGCCSSHGGITNSCAANGNVYCADGSVSPTCKCSSCGVSPPPPPPTLGQIQAPGAVTFPATNVGMTSSSISAAIRNVGALSVTVTGISSTVPEEFIVTSTTCSVVAGGGSCSATIAFKPTASGARTASIRIANTGVGGTQSFAVSGAGVAVPTTPPLASVVEAVEYYHAAWDHYFVTSIAAEISKLDDGTFVGWKRTGYRFNVYAAGTATTASVCRFFSTAFNPRSSHFYTPISSECGTVKSNPSWSFEGEVLGVLLPSSSGACAGTSQPLYRLYNNGAGAAPNHRYTTELAVRASMITIGWVAEGYGADGVIACVPK